MPASKLCLNLKTITTYIHTAFLDDFKKYVPVVTVALLIAIHVLVISYLLLHGLAML